MSSGLFLWTTVPVHHLELVLELNQTGRTDFKQFCSGSGSILAQLHRATQYHILECSDDKYPPYNLGSW